MEMLLLVLCLQKGPRSVCVLHCALCPLAKARKPRPRPPPLIYLSIGGRRPPRGGRHDVRHGDVSSTPPRLVSTLGVLEAGLSPDLTQRLLPQGRAERERDRGEKK